MQTQIRLILRSSLIWIYTVSSDRYSSKFYVNMVMLTTGHHRNKSRPLSCLRSTVDKLVKKKKCQIVLLPVSFLGLSELFLLKNYDISLTLKAPITTAADDIHKFFIVFSKKRRLDVSSESSARQRIHMKNQAIFSSKDKSKKLKCRLM